MATDATLYDLVLLLSPDAEESTRSKILSDVESAISRAGGSVERNDDWGRRPMTYEIRHQPEAEYHLLQFHAPGSLIEELSHTLRITDGVVRSRVIKVRPGTPEAPSSPPPVVAAAPGHGGSSSPSGSSEGHGARAAGEASGASGRSEAPAARTGGDGEAPAGDAGGEPPAAA